jgi:hypothetical protein
LIAASSCSTDPGTDDGGETGGTTFTGGSAGVSTSGAAGSSGSGTTGGASTGGATTGGSAGASIGGSTTGGSTTGGSTTGGTGGSTIGGSGGAPTGGTAAGGSAGQMGGTGGSGTGGSSVGGAGSGDSYVSNVAVAVHAQVRTILVVTWNQMTAADTVHLEFTFENGEILRSRAKPGAVGMKRDVTLGVPASTPVTIRIVSTVGGTGHATRDYMGTTGALPAGLPVPTVTMYNAQRASPERYLFGAVELSQQNCAGGRNCYNRGVFWTYIMDRKGRMVWYYSDAASNATSSFQRHARDGEYIWIEKRPYGRSGIKAVLKMSLDHQYSEQIDLPDLADSIDVTTDGSLLYNSEGAGSAWQLKERTRAGQTRNIWSCPTAFGSGFSCYSNTVNWNETTNTIMTSFPEENTVAEIHRQTGMLVATYGDHTGSYAYSPANYTFEFQHFPNLSPQGTLMLSSHKPGHNDTYTATAGNHEFQEWTIDRTNRRLTLLWSYNAGPEWAMWKGMAIKLANGNVLANYGSGGVIREITQDKATVFHVKFDAPITDDNYNNYVGNNFFINDLYAMNGAGPRP